MSEQFQTGGYYPSWAVWEDKTLPTPEVICPEIDNVYYAFYKPESGVVTEGDFYADQGDKFTTGDKTYQGQLDMFVDLPNKNRILSIGGWGDNSREFSAIASSDYGRKNFSESVSTKISETALSGVDIDWEYPVAGGLHSGHIDDIKNFSLLLEQLRSDLDQVDHSKVLTVALNLFKTKRNNYELPRILDTVDWVNAMTYDFHGEWDPTTKHHAALFASQDTISIESITQELSSEGVNLNKIHLGIPFYGRVTEGVRFGLSNGLGRQWSSAKQGEQRGFSRIYSSIINDPGWEVYYDKKRGASYASNRLEGKFISFDNQTMIDMKRDFAIENGYGGIFAWELSTDHELMLTNAMLGKYKK